MMDDAYDARWGAMRSDVFNARVSKGKKARYIPNHIIIIKHHPTGISITRIIMVHSSSSMVVPRASVISCRGHRRRRFRFRTGISSPSTFLWAMAVSAVGMATVLMAAISSLPLPCEGWVMVPTSSSRILSTTTRATTTTTRRSGGAFLLSSTSSSSNEKQEKAKEHPHDHDHDQGILFLHRRDLLRDSLRIATTTAAVAVAGGAGLVASPSTAFAASDATTSSTSTSSTTTPPSPPSVSDLLLRLKSIPVFSIVDPNGVPFMIFDGQAKATGYFFLSFDIANQALQDARQKDKNAGAAQVWTNAKIIVVPLAVALQLSLRKSLREAINGDGIRFNTFNDIVPSQEGVDDAKALDSQNPAKWEQKGRVPLFYIPGLTLSEDGREPRYFNQRDLLKEWQRQHPSSSGNGNNTDDLPPPPPPPVQIVEMIDLYRVALGSASNLDSISNIAIMPVQESNQVASQLMKSMSSSSSGPISYSFNKVFLVGSAKG